MTDATPEQIVEFFMRGMGAQKAVDDLIARLEMPGKATRELQDEAVVAIKQLHAEVVRLKAERHTTKQMLEEVLARHGMQRP